MPLSKWLNKVTCGDCVKVMQEMPSDIVDTVISDVPYELGLMGKSWDSTGIAYNVDMYKELLRVAKPGATFLCFGGTRTFHRIACAVEDAGWRFVDTLMWHYVSGFPKAYDIGKGLDKRAGCENLFKRITDDAKLWNGWKSHALKPSFEPILMFVKPMKQTYIDNALQYGVSGLNIANARVPNKPRSTSKNGNMLATSIMSNGEYKDATAKDVRRVPPDDGYPANTILNCDCDNPHDNDCPLAIFESQLKGSSRVFVTTKSTKKERNAGCEDLEERAAGCYSGRRDGSLSGTTQYVLNEDAPDGVELEVRKYLGLSSVG